MRLLRAVQPLLLRGSVRLLPFVEPRAPEDRGVPVKALAFGRD